MSDMHGFRLAWVLVALAGVSGAALFYGGPPAGAADDHDEAHEMRSRGEVLPLAEMLKRPELAGQRVLEADLEHDGDRMVYELEMLDSNGRVHKRYLDAATGEPLQRHNGDD
ncbi:MAG: peptidase [Chromatiaceae bacterium]|jgi:uncharacterized membrane protein YkoI|nr:peptidase [Chromatiaceae bacterium]